MIIRSSSSSSLVFLIFGTFRFVFISLSAFCCSRDCASHHLVGLLIILPSIISGWPIKSSLSKNMTNHLVFPLLNSIAYSSLSLFILFYVFQILFTFFKTSLPLPSTCSHPRGPCLIAITTNNGSYLCRLESTSMSHNNFISFAPDSFTSKKTSVCPRILFSPSEF